MNTNAIMDATHYCRTLYLKTTALLTLPTMKNYVLCTMYYLMYVPTLVYYAVSIRLCTRDYLYPRVSVIYC